MSRLHSHISNQFKTYRISRTFSQSWKICLVVIEILSIYDCSKNWFNLHLILLLCKDVSDLAKHKEMNHNMKLDHFYKCQTCDIKLGEHITNVYLFACKKCEHCSETSQMERSLKVNMTSIAFVVEKDLEGSTQV